MSDYTPTTAFDFTPGADYTPATAFDFNTVAPATLDLLPGPDPVAQAGSSSPALPWRLSLYPAPSQAQAQASAVILARILDLAPFDLSGTATATAPALTVGWGGLFVTDARAPAGSTIPALVRVPGPLAPAAPATATADCSTPQLAVWELNDRTTGQLWPAFG